MKMRTNLWSKPKRRLSTGYSEMAEQETHGTS
jgi:hypothetical protein